MLHIFARRSDDVRYFTSDPAYELAGLRDGPAGWWIRGGGDLSDPERVGTVFGGSSRSRTIGYDLIFSAPRTLSVLLAIDEMAGIELIRSHRLAVSAGVAYLEAHALGVRRRITGESELIPARWREIASFTHGVNRSGEPHLHDHVLVGATPERGNRAFDSRGLFAHLEAADALYRSELRYRVGVGTTYMPVRTFSGNELVVGVDDGYRALWSGRESGNLPKRIWTREEIRGRWAQDLSRFRPFAESAPLVQNKGEFDEHAFAAQLSSETSIFRRNVVSAWANATSFGSLANVSALSIDRLLNQSEREVGVRESEIIRSRVLQLDRVRAYGPRPLEVNGLADWLAREVEPRVFEPRRELNPLRSFRSVEPNGKSLSAIRYVSD